MGYDIERFVSPVKEDLICSICRDVLEDPLQSPSCEHAYCSICIQGWLVHRGTCPEDRLPLHIETLKPLFRYMKNDLDSLLIKCKYQQIGCTAVCRLEDLPRHENECEHTAVICPNVGCQQVIEQQLFEQHLEECRFQARECPNGCGLTILESSDNEHSCISELRLELECLESEMICRLQEQEREAEDRLAAHRRHLVERENALLRQNSEVLTQVTELIDTVEEIETRRRE